MKKLTMIIFLVFIEIANAQQLKLNVESEAALLINVDSGVVLYEKNAHTQYYPASITKVATAAYALEKTQGTLDVPIIAQQAAIVTVTEEDKIRVNYSTPGHWLVTGGCHIGIKKGEMLSLEDLLYGMMIASGNDAANVIAQHIGGSIGKFMDELNQYIRSLGCSNTHFCNPHGLHHPDHKTTAYDMALIAQAAMKNSKFRDIVKTVRYTRPKTNKQDSTVLVQTNKLLKKGPLHYPKAIGVKTGSTSMAQNTFIGAAQSEDRTLIAVLLKSKERENVFKDASTLFEAAFNQKKVQKSLIPKGEQKFTLNLEGASKAIRTYTKNDLTVEFYPAEEQEIKCYLTWDALKLPVQKDQKVGQLTVRTIDGKVIQELPLYAINSSSKSFWKSFF